MASNYQPAPKRYGMTTYDFESKIQRAMATTVAIRALAQEPVQNSNGCEGITANRCHRGISTACSVEAPGRHYHIICLTVSRIRVPHGLRGPALSRAEELQERGYELGATKMKIGPRSRGRAYTKKSDEYGRRETGARVNQPFLYHSNPPFAAALDRRMMMLYDSLLRSTTNTDLGVRNANPADTIQDTTMGNMALPETSYSWSFHRRHRSRH